MNCLIKQYSDVTREKWNSFVYSNSGGWAYMLYDVINLDWDVNLENLSFAIVDADNEEEIMMLVQLHKTNNHPLAAKLHLAKERIFSRWGYVVKDNLTKKQLRSVKDAFENYIDNYMKKQHIRRFYITLPPLTEMLLASNRSAINPLIYFNFEPRIRYTWVVDLSKSDERMLADCEETTRQAIRKTEASGRYVVVDGRNQKEDCDVFMALHKETYIRTHSEKMFMNRQYYENMFFNLIPAGVCRVFFLEDTQIGEIVAAVATLVYKNTAYYWWGGSKDAKEVGINKYLLFKAMCIIRESFNKDGWFETGGAHVYLRKGKMKGISDFKKCFGTELFPIFEGTYSRK